MLRKSNIFRHATSRAIRCTIITIERIAADIAGYLHGEPDMIKRRGRNNVISEAQKIIAYVAHRTYGISVRMIARFYGVGGSAVSMMIPEGEVLAKRKKISITD